ncbi:MAG TPA: hypothetical protein VJ770_02605 [Stellaceae bacterium]|nr:hypothetical protein [Stellaceae bacterium]
MERSETHYSGGTDGFPPVLAGSAPLREQDHRMSSMLFGIVHQIGPGTLRWNAGSCSA